VARWRNAVVWRDLDRTYAEARMIDGGGSADVR
jgi:hypothetical protein